MIKTPLHSLKKSEKAIINEVDIEKLPTKLIELGCLPGACVQVLEKSFSECPIYLNINGVYVAIRKKEAEYIFITKQEISDEK